MCHYISPGRCKPVFLLLTFLISFTGWTLADTAPPDVHSVGLYNVTGSSITATWTAPAGGNITEYRVTVSNGSIILNDTTHQLFYTANNLLPGVTYIITVYSMNANGTSSNGTSATRTTWPSSVSGFNVSAKGENYVNLTWTVPNDINSNNYTYNVLWQPDNKNISITTNHVQVTGLLPGVSYNFTIYTLTSDGVRSNAYQETKSTTRPSSVSGFNVSAKGENYVHLAWTVPNNTNSDTYTYNVLWQPDNKNISVTTNYVQVTGLSPGVSYNFTIYTLTSDGVRSDAYQETQTTTRPSSVSGFNVSAVGEKYVNLTWTVPNNTNSDTYTYNVLWQPGNMNINITTNHVQVTGLSPGVRYNFTIYTLTSDGVRSDAYQETQTTTKPSSVFGFNVSAVGEKYVNLTWTVPNNTNSDTYTYNVLWQPDNKNISVTTNYVQVTGLSPGVSYNFTIYTLTSDGVRSDVYQVAKTTTRPSSVSGFNVSDVGEKYVNLTWTIPNNTNSDTYTYNVLWQPDNKNISVTTNYVQVTGLSPGVRYNFTIYTLTSDGVRSDAYQETQTTTRPSSVSGFIVSAVGINYVNLSWMVPNDTYSKIYTYNVLGQPDNVNITNITTNSVNVTGLSPGVSYNFIIYTVTSDGMRSATVQETQTTTRPNKPNNINGANSGVSELIINWTAPGDPNNNSYIYQVTWSISQNQAAQQNRTDTTKDTNFTIKDLFPGYLYSIAVVSVISNTSSADSLINLRTNPVAAKTLNVTNITNTTATLQWILPDNYSSSYQSGYIIQNQYQTNGVVLQSIKTTNTSYVLTNLEPGTQYIFTVITVASAAFSERRRRSVSADIITYSTGTITQDETEPDPVTSPYCYKVDGYQIKVTFTCPNGNYTSFEVLVNSKNNINTSSCTNDVIISNLQPANSYVISIKTVAMQKTSNGTVISCSTDSTGVIVGAIFGVLLFLLLIGLIVFFVMKKRRTKDQPETLTSMKKKFHSITKEKFKQHYDHNHADSDFGFAEEYQELSSVGTTQSKRAAEMPDNRAKNRFTNVLPYDHSRVKLSTIDGIASTDYINANYMPGYNSTKEFIASQGPLVNTTADFWRMIWEHHVNTIVMLTNCMENGRAKCEHYWPLDYTPCTYEDITVAVTSETILSEWTIRDFSVKHAKQQGIKYVRHFHFTAWPDHGVPDSTSSIIDFRNLVREHMDQRKSNGPTIVHCSAGVGRTGTLIALDYLIQQMEKEHRIGIYGFVEKMRTNRTLMVQTEAQYIFLNKCMLDLIEQPPEENIYENQMGNELIYENASAVRNFQNENV
ncbi:receptor-type tyrosine-protein phosphatase H [Pseudophryne corroboree]|uniref:receptor-type tyrosine-protein phosphatase H n=1 Tax=Pseudophryne corroboree TaxID=495146 RepID=UPI003081CD7F